MNRQLLGKYFLINLLIALLLVLGFIFFDLTLELNQFHGLVAQIFIYYGMIALALVNMIIAAFLYKRYTEKAKAIFMSGVSVALIVALINLSYSYIVQ